MSYPERTADYPQYTSDTNTPQYAPTAIITPARVGAGEPPAPYSGLGTPGLTPQQHGWLKLAAEKNQLFEYLQAGELKVQALLNTLPPVTKEAPDALNANLATLQARLKEGKQIAATNKEARLSFTTMITERIINPAMEFEKRSAAVIATASARELEMRKAAEEIANAAADLKREENALIAHISNEQIRIASNYRSDLANRVTQFYIACLNAATPAPDLEDLKQALTEIQPGTFNKFQRRLLTVERATEVMNANIQPYDPNSDFQAVLASIPERFAMYQEDLKNADAAAAKAKADAEKEAEEAKAETELAVATNTLMAQAETAAVDAPKVRRKLEAVEDNSQAWAFAVISAFVRNSAACAPKLRVKSWAKLNIGQMAKALADVAGETGEMFQGVSMKEVEK